jgi:hypothetical protein
MKYRGSGIVALLLCILSTASAQEYSIANVTTCGVGFHSSPKSILLILQLSCVVALAPTVNCSVLDTACQCKNTELPKLITNCLLENCTMHDGLSGYSFPSLPSF